MQLAAILRYASKPNPDALPYERDDFDDSPVKPVKPKKPKKRRGRSAMDIAADACGLVKVRGALGGVYYE